MKLKSSTQKILAAFTSFAMVLTLVAGLTVAAASAATTTVTTTTTSSSYAYTRDLTIGSTGDDVTALQAMLYADGFLKVAPTGYFGTLTQAALAGFQASVGISPAAGYFGPITRTYLAANVSTGTTSSVPGCAAGAMYSATTGAPCTSTSSVPGCVAGAMYSSTTGAPCTTNSTLPAGCVAGAMYSSTTGVSCASTTTTVTGNGVLTVTQDPAVVTNTNITSYTNVPVYGLQLQAQLGSVTVNQLQLAVTDQVGSNYENPGAFVNSVSVVDPSTNTVLMTMPVSASNFIVNPSSSTSFYLQLSGLNFVVPANTTKDLVVEFNTAGSIDTSRTLIVSGYSSNSLQYFTSGNIVNYADIQGISVQSIFNTPNSTSLVVGIDGSNPSSSTQYVNSNSGAQGVVLLAFNVQSSSGNVTITNASTTLTSSGTAPSAIYLYDGSQVLSAVSPSVTASSTYVTFNNFSDVVSAGTTKVLTIRADFPSNTNAGTQAQATLNSVTYTTAGGQINNRSVSLTGNTQTFYSASANLAFVSASTPVANYSGGANSPITNYSGSFTFTLTPQPGSEVQPVANDFVVKVGTTTAAQAYINATVGAPQITPTPTGSNPLSQGTTYTVTLPFSVSTTSLPTGTGFYTFFLTSASTTVNNINGAPVTNVQTGGLDNFKSPSFNFTK